MNRTNSTIAKAYCRMCESSPAHENTTKKLPLSLKMVRKTPEKLTDGERETILAMLSELDRLHDGWHGRHGLDIVRMKKKDFDERQNQRIDSAKHVFLALDSDDKVQGTAMYQKGRFEDTQMLTALFVSPSYRGNGVGKALLEKSMGELKSDGTKHVELQVSEYNKEGKKLYEKLGFENITYGLIREL